MPDPLWRERLVRLRVDRLRRQRETWDLIESMLPQWVRTAHPDLMMLNTQAYRRGPLTSWAIGWDLCRLAFRDARTAHLN